MLDLLKKLFSIKVKEKETVAPFDSNWPFPKSSPATACESETAPAKKPAAKKPAAKKPAAKKPAKPKTKKQTS